MKIGKWDFHGKQRFTTEIDYESGVKNVRSVGPRQFQFIEVIDMPSATGEGDRSQRWHVEVTYVDLDAIPTEEVRSAIASHGGVEQLEGLTVDQQHRALAEMCDGYGLHARLWQDMGSNRRKLLAAAYREANEALDADDLNERLLETANKIGTSQLDMMRGNVYAGLATATGPDAEIMKKMCAACLVPCPACGGLGRSDTGEDAPCSTCEGKGKVMSTLGGPAPVPPGVPTQH